MRLAATVLLCGLVLQLGACTLVFVAVKDSVITAEPAVQLEVAPEQ